MSSYLLAQQSPVFDGVEPQVVSTLLASSRRQRVARGEPVAPGFGLLFVFSGAVKLSFTNEEGAQVMVRLVRAGGFACACPGSRREEAGEALEESDVLGVPRTAFFSALGASHRLTRNVLEAAGARLDADAEVIRSFAFSSVEERVEGLLTMLAAVWGRPFGHGRRIELPLTQDGLADLLGVGRRSVTRAISRWSREGVLTKRDGRFVLRAPSPLAGRGLG